MAFSLLQQKKTNPHDEAEKIVAKATRKSEDLLTEATKEAELIISQTQGFREELQKNLKDDIAFQAGKFARAYDELLPEIKKYYQAGIDQQLKTLQEQIEGFAQDMRVALTSQVSAVSSLLKEQVTQEFAGVQQQLQQYKKEKMVEIDNQVKTVVKAAVFEIVGKSLSASDHQELIIKALEKAKKDGLFEKK